MKLQNLITACSMFVVGVGASLLMSGDVRAESSSTSYACNAGGQGIVCSAGAAGCWMGSFERDQWGYLYCDTQSQGTTNCCRSNNET